MESHLRTLARAQADLGIEVQVCCVNHLDQQGRDVTWKPFAVTETVAEHDGPVRLIRLGRQACLSRLDVCLDLRRLLAQLCRAPLDLLHLHVPNPTMLLAMAMVRSRIPRVVTYHSDVVRQRALGLALRPFEHLVFRRSARILVDSPQYPAGSPLLRQYGAKVGVLPLGIDPTPYFRPSAAALMHAQRLRAELGQPLWLAVGRLVYYKGLHQAIRALRQVQGTLLVIGTGPLEEELRRLAREVGVADRVRWHGHASEEALVGAYQAATALWFPSNARSESFGLVQVEAMASGCPVINASIPASGVSWVSRHEETGLTIPVNDADALAMAAKRLLTEVGLRERLSQNARQRACQEFDHRTMACRSVAVYREVLTRKPE